MSNSSQPKLGFPVLVHLTTSDLLSLPFQLRIQYDAARKQATFMLGTAASAFLEGASDAHAFIAQYDADNLDSNTPNNNHVQLQLPPSRLDELKRDNGTPQVVPVTLRLKRPCPLWCPRLDALMPAAAPNAEASFKELVQLSKATTVHITLNRKWLTDEQMRLIQVIKSGSNTLSGYPVARYYSNFFKQADWTIFGPESPSKRPRDVSAPSTPPHYKRHESSTPFPSPTEVATSPSHSQIAALLSHNPEGNKDENNVQTETINNIVGRQLPSLVQQLLPNVVAQNLPDLLTLPISFSPYISDLDTPSPSNPNTVPHSRDLTPLGANLMPFILDHLRPQVQRMISSSMNRGVESRQQQALLEIGEAADQKITEIQMERDCGLDAMRDMIDAMMDDMRHKNADAVQALRLEGDCGLDALVDAQDDFINKLGYEKADAVEALQWEKEEGMNDLRRHAEEVLDELRVNAEDVGDYTLEDVDARITSRADEIVAAAHAQIEMITDKAIRQMKGNTTLLRGRRPGQRAGKGGYYGLGQR